MQNELTMLGQKLDNQQIDLKLMHCFVTSRLAGPFSCPNICYRGKRQIEERQNGLGRNVIVLYRDESSSDVKKKLILWMTLSFRRVSPYPPSSQPILLPFICTPIERIVVLL